MEHMPKPLTYADLPASPRGGVMLTCDCEESYGSDYSAARGDYWEQNPATPILCAECGGPMHLVRMVVTFRRIRPEEAGR